MTAFTYNSNRSGSNRNLDDSGHSQLDRGEANVFSRWLFFLCVIPKTFTDHFVSVDLSVLWRRHLVWAKKDGSELKNIVTSRYASTTVFLSLLVSSEIGVLFSPSTPAETFRKALQDHPGLSGRELWCAYFAGIFLGISIVSSISALVANFTAWSIFSSLSKENTAIVLRSSLGLYAAQLPSRLVTMAIYLFFIWINLFWYVIYSLNAAIALTVISVVFFSHTITTYSAIARIIMHTSAMGNESILEQFEEEQLSPAQLSDALIENALRARVLDIPVNRQYKIRYQDRVRQEATNSQRMRNARFHAQSELYRSIRSQSIYSAVHPRVVGVRSATHPENNSTLRSSVLPVLDRNNASSPGSDLDGRGMLPTTIEGDDEDENDENLNK